ncbi:hypothetical protein DGo_CA0343 [Deinococcus gobiensis I-0]|uniref:Uncharacterized protein n=1 Tax=Deinococcus gobiensis (strain DSM 21396 / JCM 16679 / CGMCC 1.7299 / I-0) TaxID=745776 RepID=H8GUT7_DEIGI|nr:hypothetical protein DGo_CA0343 [Deinococcus gobiensis I-0]
MLLCALLSHRAVLCRGCGKCLRAAQAVPCILPHFLPRASPLSRRCRPQRPALTPHSDGRGVA